MKVMVSPHAQIIGHPLSDALGKVIGYVGCGRVQDGDDDDGYGCRDRKMHPVSVQEQRLQ